MRTYELLYIISPTVSDQDVEKVVEQVTGHVTSLGARLVKVENLGRRPLAYEIQHHREGTYVVTEFESQGQEIPELERRLRVMDTVLRYLTVCLDASRRRVARMKRKRSNRKAARTQAAALSKTALTEEVFEDIASTTESEEEES
ncbi:MAG: 30S ribosomal protein S6 [Acidobacteriota bacterium]|nr:30S ribosomal protein S6 [Blastocatellia bacterium]MDW8241230.1 30S ribosomal protein S6 [Acidobacteriota bacterium]